MGVIYKLKDEVIHFIISERKSNPLLSCRQLAESASQKFSLRLSKSSVHDVLKESGVITPRGRKPKDKFKIPHEKKKQIQESLSQVKLLPQPPTAIQPESPNVIQPEPPSAIQPEPTNVILSESNDLNKIDSSEYQEAGRIFLKAALWDLGIYSEDNIKEEDWKYYLTYSKGIKVVLENDKSFFIDLFLPLERCIKETADGLINNIKPFLVDKVSDQGLFKSCMDAEIGFKMNTIIIVDGRDRILFEYGNIVEQKRLFNEVNRVFVENYDNNLLKRTKMVFFPQDIDNIDVMNNILNLNGFDITNEHEFVINLLVGKDFKEKEILQQAAERLNGMCLYDEQNRLVKVKI